MNLHPRSARSHPLASCEKPNVTCRLRTPIAKAILALAAASGLMAGLPGQAGAGVITYDYKTKLSPAYNAQDREGLGGATVELKVDVNDDARYTADWGGAVFMNNDATVTISGAARSANNATYALGQLMFLPSYAGVLTAGGTNPNIMLADGTYLIMNFRQAGTTHGSEVQIDDVIDVRDFAPTLSRLGGWSAGDVLYSQYNVIITASLPSTSADTPPGSAAVPEPASVALFGIGSVAALGAVRRRRAA